MRLRGCFFVMQWAAAVWVLSLAGWCAETPVSVAKVAGGVLLTTAHDQLHIAVCEPAMVHVTAGPDAPKASSPQQPWIVGSCAGGAFSLAQTEKFYLLSTDALQVKISVATGGLQFADQAGNTLLTEGVSARKARKDWTTTFYTGRGGSDHPSLS